MKFVNKVLQKEIDDWFGYVKESNGSAKASSIIVEESTISNSKTFRLTRNKIDRFSGGSAESALYSEEIVFNGDTYLTIKVKKELNGQDNKYIIGLIALVIKDIANGLVAIGGQTAIGRGLFEVTEVIKNGTQITYDNSQKSLDDMIAEIYKVATSNK